MKYTFVDLQSLTTELHLRGFDREKVDEALRLLVHVHAVQDSASEEVGGILAEDVIDKYDLDVVQAALQLFLEKAMFQGKEVLRVRWGSEAAAEEMEDQLWAHGSTRWEEFVSQLDERYLGLFMTGSDADGRIPNNWKLGKELRWFSFEVPSQGWKILGIIGDITEIAWKLDLAFGFRPFMPDGVRAPQALLHKKAFEVLKGKRVAPPEELLRSIRLWRFFSEYDVNSTDFVGLMRECDLTLDDVVRQVGVFFSMNLTSEYREGQYPPYFVNDKKKKEFQQAIRDLLQPMNSWLLHRDLVHSVPQASIVTQVGNTAVTSPRTLKRGSRAPQSRPSRRPV